MKRDRIKENPKNKEGADEQKLAAFTIATEEVYTLAAKLISDKTRYSGLAEAKIEYWMANKGLRKCKEEIDADTKLVTGINREVTGTVFRIIINAKRWEKSNTKSRGFILENQLYRCCKDTTDSGEVRWYVRDYTVKAFPSIIADYGLITPEIQQLHKAIQQLELDFDQQMDKAGAPASTEANAA